MARLGAVLRSRIAQHLLAAALVLSAASAAAPTAAGASAGPLPGAPVPRSFVGVDAGAPLFGDDATTAQQLGLMVASGVQSVRVVFNWSDAQPYKSWADVPSDQRGNYVDEGGVPTNFAQTDKVVAAASVRGLTVLPTVLFAPGWDQQPNPSHGFPTPASAGPYADYLTALIHRYGPHGTYWNDHGPRTPIRSWQVWNEPNISAYWPQPFAQSYVALLRVAHAAIKRADPGAKVVLGAITNLAWRYLGQIYRIHGAGKLFDVIAVNGFTTTPNRVIEFLQLVRRAVNRLGDPRKPLLATELSWPSAVGKPVHHHDWDTTERGQARKIGALLPLLAAHRKPLRLSGFDYFTWISQVDGSLLDDFSYAGLLSYRSSDGAIASKPALQAFRSAALKLERCRRKGRQATRCVKSR